MWCFLFPVRICKRGIKEAVFPPVKPRPTPKVDTQKVDIFSISVKVFRKQEIGTFLNILYHIF